MISQISKNDFYVKKISYGQYIRSIIMPLESVNSNPRNFTGKKNTGERTSKMLNSIVRTKSIAVRKAFHNFGNLQKLTFLTLTYRLNEINVSRCKFDLAKFFKRLKYYFKKQNQDIRYFYVYEYQQRGAVHFHILLDVVIPHKVVLKFWPVEVYGANRNLLVRENTNEEVAKYCSKYISLYGLKKTNVNDINVKAYQFSYNCENPKVEKFIFNGTFDSVIKKTLNSRFVKFLKINCVEKFKTQIVGAIYEFKNNDYLDNSFQKYDPTSLMRFGELRH